MLLSLRAVLRLPVGKKFSFNFLPIKRFRTHVFFFASQQAKNNFLAKLPLLTAIESVNWQTLSARSDWNNIPHGNLSCILF